MRQLLKTMTAAGMIATGLPLLTEAASAQTAYQWYQFSPLYCWSTFHHNANGTTATTLNVAVNLNGSVTYIAVPDSHLISALYLSCSVNSGFWAWYNGPGDGWTDFYTYPGLH